MINKRKTARVTVSGMMRFRQPWPNENGSLKKKSVQDFDSASVETAIVDSQSHACLPNRISLQL
jgi:hypothetical protein